VFIHIECLLAPCLVLILMIMFQLVLNFISRALALAKSKRDSIARDVDSQSKTKRVISPLAIIRSGPPFVPAYDITRGILHMGQAFLTYALMLAVMYVLFSEIMEAHRSLTIFTGRSKQDLSSQLLLDLVLEKHYSDDIGQRIRNNTS
jgi:hypothetical protein